MKHTWPIVAATPVAACAFARQVARRISDVRHTSVSALLANLDSESDVVRSWLAVLSPPLVQPCGNPRHIDLAERRKRGGR